MPSARSLGNVLTLAALACAAPVAAQQAPGRAVSAARLRANLSILAADSMGGRDTGSRGDFLAADYVAAEFRRLGLRPAGENGGYFQTIPFVHIHPDTALRLLAGVRSLVAGIDLIPFGNWTAAGKQAVFGGTAGDSLSYPPAEAVSGRLVVLAAPGAGWRAAFAAVRAAARQPSLHGAAAFAVAGLDEVPGDLRDQLMQGGFSTDTTTPRAPVILLVSRAAAAALLGAEPATLQPGALGPALSGGVGRRRDPLPFAARNVLAVLPGSSPALGRTYVSVSAHNDHVGYTAHPVDHDSAFAYNRVIRPLGADSPDRQPTPAEAARIAAMRDSLRRLRPDRPDSIFNGADDDGSGTVALLEVARVLAAAPRRPRSVLFVSHAAEERGLLGSGWFTDHPTVERDSIVGEVDMDMVGRGNASDLPEGGPGYLEVIGSRRLSTEFGDLLEQVNARQPAPFHFNYAYDAPGHPLQYYCRADHYSYARYGIPSVALSRGEHADYHQVTDEVEYIHFDALARVTGLVADFVSALASLDHPPRVVGPHGDPHAPCRQ